MYILGIDIGGTKTAVAVADTKGRVLAKNRFATQRTSGPEAIIGAINEAVRALFAEVGVTQEQIEGIGISCGGPLDPFKGNIIFVPNIPGWENLPITKLFSDEFGAPAWVDNDATLAAFGEAVFGAGRSVDDFIYFQVSTGIGSGIIIGGKPYRGCGNAGEFGHHKIVPEGPECGCGDRGCLEALASGRSIAREAASKLQEHPESLLYEWTEGDGAKVTAEMVARSAAQGDAYGSEVWDRVVGYLGLGIANAVNILNPALVVLGGGVTRAGEQLFGPVRKIVSERAMSVLRDDVTIVPPALGDESPLMGAIALAMEKLGYESEKSVG